MYLKNTRLDPFKLSKLLGVCLLLLFTGCEGHPWNDPYPNENPHSNTLYNAFTERPNHLDPARSYVATESVIIGQIYEPPLQYHYLKRPFTLEPLVAANMPKVRYLDKAGKEIKDPKQFQNVEITEYEIKIKPGIYYQPHPAFAKEGDQYKYLSLTSKEIEHYQVLSDFKSTGTRECIAEDFVYQIKRLAEPSLSSPIYGVMSNYILGLKDLREQLTRLGIKREEIDLRPYSIEGAKTLDRYTYLIRLKGIYPQFQYWLAMSFFAPMPWEAAQFFAQKGFSAKNLSLDWYPIGTGPFMLNENNPERRMTLIRNPNFREAFFPTEGMPEDQSNGLLEDAGKRIPFLDKVIFTLEKEDIPYWNKFLEGYYDISGISSDNFSSALHLSTRGQFALTDDLKKLGIRLQTSVSPSVWFWGFNMLDETVGGYTESHKKLRKALRMVFDVDEFISIFINGRGVRAEGPLPPDTFGYETQPKEHEGSLEEARKLMSEAGYSKGLTLYLDATITGDPEEIALLSWLKNQFAKLNVHLVIRGSDFNRFQSKVDSGSAQIFFRGWGADYPDPENFLFLFYGPNGTVEHDGENDTNYKNELYDRLFEKMRALPNGKERLDVIGKMIEILNNDNPVIWGFYPKSYALYHGWMRITKPAGIINNNYKYLKINSELRYKQRTAWNQPRIWPFFVLIVLLIVILIPPILQYSKKIHKPMERL